MMMALLPNDQRRAALSAGLLASNHDGEVLAAARALCMLLKKINLDPASVVSAGLSVVTAAKPTPSTSRTSTSSDMEMRVRRAGASPRLNDWERGFLADIAWRRSLTAKQQNTLRTILEKAERKAA